MCFIKIYQWKEGWQNVVTQLLSLVYSTDAEFPFCLSQVPISTYALLLKIAFNKTFSSNQHKVVGMKNNQIFYVFGCRFKMNLSTLCRKMHLLRFTTQFGPRRRKKKLLAKISHFFSRLLWSFRSFSDFGVFWKRKYIYLFNIKGK